jgi:hypothetical protein
MTRATVLELAGVRDTTPELGPSPTSVSRLRRCWMGYPEVDRRDRAAEILDPVTSQSFSVAFRAFPLVCFMSSLASSSDSLAFRRDTVTSPLDTVASPSFSRASLVDSRP